MWWGCVTLNVVQSLWKFYLLKIFEHSLWRITALPLLCVVFSVHESVSLFYKIAVSGFAREALAMWALVVLVDFFSFPPEINPLLLCFWFPGSWLVLPRQNLNTAPLFSPQEQCLNVEFIPTLTEDAQNWIWGEVGSYDVGTVGGNQKNPSRMASSPSSNFKLAPKYWEAAISLSWWILNTVSKSIVFSSALQNKIPLVLVSSQWPCLLFPASNQVNVDFSLLNLSFFFSPASVWLFSMLVTMYVFWSATACSRQCWSQSAWGDPRQCCDGLMICDVIGNVVIYGFSHNTANNLCLLFVLKWCQWDHLYAIAWDQGWLQLF